MSDFLDPNRRFRKPAAEAVKADRAEVPGTNVSTAPGVVPARETGTTDETGRSLAAKIEVGAEKLARVLENATKLFAYVCVMASWLVIGFIAWLPILFGTIIVLIALGVFRLVAGLQVDRETTRFLDILQFWPDGFTSLTRAFWSKDDLDQLKSTLVSKQSQITQLPRSGLFMLSFLCIC